MSHAKKMIVAAMLLAGCQKDPCQPQQVPPSKPQIRQQKEQPPSSEYLAGYSDSYYANFVAPFKYAFSSDYRSGCGAGKYDREHGLPHRYK